jgi:NAD(P)H-hydrate epimerase
LDNTVALLTTDDMKKAEAYADKNGTSYLQMMENAGQAIYDCVNQHYSKRKVVVLCGPGNNGGDGFVVARLLKQNGWDVIIAGEAVAKTADSEHMRQLWEDAILPLQPDVLDGNPLVIDALFGAGLMRPLEGNYGAIVQEMNNRGLDVIAVDIPSGVDGNTGEILGIAPKAQHTVTFLRKKPGHLLVPAKARCGVITVADIAIPEECLQEIKPPIFENSPCLWDVPAPPEEGHKYTRGHTAVLAGEMSGAPRIAARAARRVGSGLVTLAGPKDIYSVLATEEPGALLHHLDTDKDLKTLLDNPKITSWLVGPGYGVGEKTMDTVQQILQKNQQTVLDADALTSFEHQPEVLFSALHENTVLTPHEGEFKRLFPNLKKDKLHNAQKAAKLSGAVVVLKGPDSIIASPDGTAVINSNGSPALATAGSGDALAGIIAGLLAQGMEPFEAAAAGVYLHAETANIFGEGLIAEDIPETLPKALHNLADNKSHFHAQK